MNSNNTQAMQNGQEQQQTPPERAEGRTFTQEDVNRIVQERLAKERAKAAPAEPDPLAEREQAIARRELELDAREAAREYGFKPEILKVLKYSNKDELTEALNTLKTFCYDPKGPHISVEQITSGGSRNGAQRGHGGFDAIREAMGLGN